MNSGCDNKEIAAKDGQFEQKANSRAAQSWGTFDRRGAVGLASSLALLAVGGGSHPVRYPCY